MPKMNEYRKNKPKHKKKKQKSGVAKHRIGIYEAEKKKKRDTDKINLPFSKLSNLLIDENF